MFIMVDFVRKAIVKKSCNYGELGSFEWELFLCFETFFLEVILLFSKLRDSECKTAWLLRVIVLG